MILLIRGGLGWNVWALLGLFIHSSGDSVQCSRFRARKGRRSPAQYIFFSRVQPLLFLSTGLNWTPTNAAHVRNATKRIALRPPPAPAHSHSHTPPTPSALSIPVSQNNNPLHPFHFDNVTSAQPHQINKLNWLLGSSRLGHSPAIITPLPIWPPLHDTTCSCGNCHGGTALHCAAHRLSIFLTALRRQHPVINLFCTRWTFQPTTQAWS